MQITHEIPGALIIEAPHSTPHAELEAYARKARPPHVWTVSAGQTDRRSRSRRFDETEAVYVMEY